LPPLDMTYIYGVVFLLALYFVIKHAVKAALTSEDVDLLLSNAVSRGLELNRQDRED
jgi:hypothetical protein